jgi:hypothetical protein
MTKQIPLTQDKVALVDDEDYERINQWKWQAMKVKYKGGELWYAVRRTGHFPHQTAVLMHREIVNATPDVDVDHRNGNGLHNTRENIRACTQSQNMANRGKTIRNTSGYKGVIKRRSKWAAQLKKGKFYFFKVFDTPEEAARAYDEKAKEQFGEFAALNFPEN